MRSHNWRISAPPSLRIRWEGFEELIRDISSAILRVARIYLRKTVSTDAPDTTSKSKAMTMTGPINWRKSWRMNCGCSEVSWYLNQTAEPVRMMINKKTESATTSQK